MSDETQTIRITDAKTKDHYANCGFEITEGIGKGGTGTFKGKGLIVKADLLNAFADLNVHLASLDDAFKSAGVSEDELSELVSHELTGKYTVVGFKLTGSEEDLKVSLIGDKYISSSLGRMYVETPAIPLEGSSYAHSHDLHEAIAKVRDEVEQYKNGKYDIQEENEIPEDDENQLSLLNEEHNEAMVTKVKAKKAKKSKKSEEETEEVELQIEDEE